VFTEAIKKLEYHWEDGIYVFDCENICTAEELYEKFTLIIGSRVNVKGNDINLLIPHICGINALYVFDNCEQSIGVFAEFCNLILQNCSNVSLAFTSRLPLDERRENIVRINSLSSSRFYSSACRLFVKSSQTKFLGSNKRKVVSICTKLEGNPLAIILVANRVCALGLNEVYKNLEDIVFSNAQNRKNRVAARHDTLFNCINWSYNLLSQNEKSLLKIIYCYPSIVPRDSLEIFNTVKCCFSALEELYKNGFLVNESLYERTYYKLPHLIKEFLNKKHQSRISETFMQKLSIWYSQFSLQIESKIYGKSSQKYLDILDKENQNILAVMKYCHEKGNADVLVNFSYLYWYCFLRGKWSVFSPYFDIINYSNLTEKDIGQIKLMNGVLKWSCSDLIVSNDYLEEAITIFSSVDYLWGKGQALHILGHVQHQMGNLKKANEIFTSSYEILINYNGDYWKALLLNDIAEIKLDLGDLESSKNLLLEAKTYSNASNDMHGYGNSLMHLGIVYKLNGDYRRAKKCFSKALRIFDGFCYQRGIGSCLKHFCDLYIARSNINKAKKYLLQALLIQERINHRIGIIRSLESLSKCLLMMKCYSESYTFYLYCKSMRESTHMLLVGGQVSELRLLEETLLQNLNDSNLQIIKQYVSNTTFGEIIKKAQVLCGREEESYEQC
jgi:tetratricopeptide (TPR) repeat protein